MVVHELQEQLEDCSQCQDTVAIDASDRMVALSTTQGLYVGVPDDHRIENGTVTSPVVADDNRLSFLSETESITTLDQDNEHSRLSISYMYHVGSLNANFQRGQSVIMAAKHVVLAQIALNATHNRLIIRVCNETTALQVLDTRIYGHIHAVNRYGIVSYHTERMTLFFQPLGKSTWSPEAKIKLPTLKILNASVANIRLTDNLIVLTTSTRVLALEYDTFAMRLNVTGKLMDSYSTDTLAIASPYSNVCSYQIKLYQLDQRIRLAPLVVYMNACNASLEDIVEQPFAITSTFVVLGSLAGQHKLTVPTIYNLTELSQPVSTIIIDFVTGEQSIVESRYIPSCINSGCGLPSTQSGTSRQLSTTSMDPTPTQPKTAPSRTIDHSHLIIMLLAAALGSTLLFLLYRHRRQRSRLATVSIISTTLAGSDNGVADPKVAQAGIPMSAPAPADHRRRQPLGVTIPGENGRDMPLSTLPSHAMPMSRPIHQGHSRAAYFQQAHSGHPHGIPFQVVAQGPSRHDADIVHSISSGSVQALHARLQMANVESLEGALYLHSLARASHSSAVLFALGRVLIAAGARLENQDDRGYTPLMLAARMGNAAAVTALIALGADPNCHLLAMAASSGDDATLRALLAAKESLKPDDLTFLDQPPLHTILAMGTPDMLKTYADDLDLPFDPCDTNGNTCWHVVVKEDRKDMMALLQGLRRGEAMLLVAKPNYAGVSPRELAHIRGSSMVADMQSLVNCMKKTAAESEETLAFRLQRAMQARTRRRQEKNTSDVQQD
eukprot:TRINITY_DN12053_c0_g1_i3.p1 TRINITY_DN12053_c0_g1~~TRINITY_DN12053_c0_g1_i3.p1  ORF type:complete len:781 (+),score=123.25 TRINITY_DN12053_c0_g1_i3:96-2438(+)